MHDVKEAAGCYFDWARIDAGRSRPRVLLIAEACNPDWESVPLVAYNLYREPKGFGR